MLGVMPRSARTLPRTGIATRQRDGRTGPTQRTRRHGTVTLVLVAALMLVLCGLARADAGDLDPTFDGDGKKTLGYGGTDVAEAVLVQPDGKIVVAGHGASTKDFTVSRLYPDGSLDSGFDGDGKKVFGSGEQPTEPSAVELQPDVMIVVAGRGGSGGTGVDFAVTRLNPDGSVDGTTFVDTDFGGDDYLNAAALQPNGKIVVAGTSNAPNSPPRMAVARYDVDGTLDETFGGTGKRTFGAGDSVSAEAVQVQPDGKVVVAGYGNEDSDFVVTRLDRDGQFDSSFGAGGTSAVEFGGAEGAYAALLQPDGKIVVAGAAVTSGADADIAAARLLPGGALDTTFSADGKTTLPSTLIEYAYAVALQPDGRIVLAGATQLNENVLLARLEGVSPPAAGGGPGGGVPGVGPAATTSSAPPEGTTSSAAETATTCSPGDWGPTASPATAARTCSRAGRDETAWPAARSTTGASAAPPGIERAHARPSADSDARSAGDVAHSGRPRQRARLGLTPVYSRAAISRAARAAPSRSTSAGAAPPESASAIASPIVSGVLDSKLIGRPAP
jgi:uncharacterized delta-60 repeat protein